MKIDVLRKYPFLILISFAIFDLLFFTHLYNKKSKEFEAIKNAENSSDFYFSGKIDSIYKVTLFNNIMLVDLDSACISYIDLPKNSAYYHGLYSRRSNKIIFYGQFNNEEPVYDPTYIEVSSRNNKIIYDKAVNPTNEIRVVTLYSKSLIKLSKNFDIDDWVYF